MKPDGWENHAEAREPTQSILQLEGGFEASTPSYSYLGMPGSPAMYIPDHARTGTVVPLSSIYSVVPGPPRPLSAASPPMRVPDLFR